MSKDSKKLQQNKIKNVGIISVFSSIVIKGIRTLFFFHKYKKQIQLLKNLEKNFAH